MFIESNNVTTTTTTNSQQNHHDARSFIYADREFNYSNQTKIKREEEKDTVRCQKDYSLSVKPQGGRTADTDRIRSPQPRIAEGIKRL